MKDLSTILPKAVVAARSTGDRFAQVKSSDLSAEQKGAIKYFYERLHRIYQSEYRRQLPDESTERASKAEFGGLIMDFTKEQIDKGLGGLHHALNDVASDYRFMKLDPIIELVRCGGNITGVRSGMYSDEPTDAMKDSRALALESDGMKSRRQKAASDTIGRMMGMFDDE